MDNSEAYAILTRQLTNMYAIERTAFDQSAAYAPALAAVREGREAEAIALVLPFRTERGDAWRVRRFGKENFTN